MAPCQMVEKILCDHHTCMSPFNAEKLQQTWSPVQYFEHVTFFGPVTKVHASTMHMRARVISRHVFTDHYREITN